MRAVGRTWEEISAELGYRSRDGARLAVERLQKRNPALSADTVRRSASEGLRVVRSVLFERFADAKVREDNEDLVMLAKELRANISETAKLHGAHAPQRTEVDVNVHHSASAIIAEARERLLSVVDAEVVEIPALTEIRR